MSSSDEDKKDEFYGQLQHILNSVKKGDITLVLGDFNAKDGTNSDLWEGVIALFVLVDAMGSVSYSFNMLPTDGITLCPMPPFSTAVPRYTDSPERLGEKPPPYPGGGYSPGTGISYNVHDESLYYPTK